MEPVAFPVAVGAGWDPAPLPPAEPGFIRAGPGFILDEKLTRPFGSGSRANGTAAVRDRAAGQVRPLAPPAARQPHVLPRPLPAG